MTLPISVIVVTKNEEKKLKTCLDALRDFGQVIVVDSQSQDKTASIAVAESVELVEFIWNRQYPKKRQWCLDHLNLKYDWVFFVDADEIVTKDLVDELKILFENDPSHAGYYVRGRYLMEGELLKYGLQNNKLVLFDRNKIEFPLVDDLDIPGIGEMEGHYQPVLKTEFADQEIGQLKSYVIHDAMDDERAWIFRHQKYARWESGMNQKNAWPLDPKPLRNAIKTMLRNSKFRPQLVFLISYVLLFGFLDGKRGFLFARRKKQYYALIQ